MKKGIQKTQQQLFVEGLLIGRQNDAPKNLIPINISLGEGKYIQASNNCGAGFILLCGLDGIWSSYSSVDEIQDFFSINK